MLARNIKLHVADTTAPVRMLKPSLDVDPKDNEVVLRGVLDPATLANLKIGDYQRELLSSYQRREIVRGIENGDRLPDIEIGMRGDHFEISDDDGFALLLDPAYIIDGQQRKESCREHLERHPTANVRLGAVVRFNTTPEYERDRFRKLNGGRTRVSPSVVLKNDKEISPFLATLYGLSHQAEFVLYGKVCWKQNKKRTELLYGASYVALVFDLHYRFVPVTNNSRVAVEVGARLVARIGLHNVRRNVHTFWTLVHDAWGIREVTGRMGAPQCKGTFLRTLARLFNDYTDFWEDDRKHLVIPADLRRKLGGFNLNDPVINKHCGGQGASGEELAFLLLKHLNSGKRTKRLEQWSDGALAGMKADE